MQSDSMVHVDEEDKEEVTTLPSTMIEPVDSEKDAALPVHDAQTPHKPIQEESEAQQEPAHIVNGVEQEHLDAGVQHEPTHDDAEDQDEFTHEDDAAVHHDQIGEVSKPTGDGFKPESLPSHHDSNAQNKPSEEETAHEDATVQPAFASEDATVQPASASEDASVQPAHMSEESAVQHEPAHGNGDVQHEPALEGGAVQHETAQDGGAIQHEPTHQDSENEAHQKPSHDGVNETADKETEAPVQTADKNAQEHPGSTEESVIETTEKGSMAEVETDEKEAQVHHEPAHSDDESQHGATQDDEEIQNKPVHGTSGEQHVLEEEHKPAQHETGIDDAPTSDEHTVELTTLSSVDVQGDVSNQVKPADSIVNQGKPEEQAHDDENVSSHDQHESADDAVGAKPSHDNVEDHKDAIENKPVDELHQTENQNDDDKLAEVTTRPTGSETSDVDNDSNVQSTERPYNPAPASTTASSLAHDGSNEHVAFDDQDQKETETTTDPQQVPEKQDELQSENGSISNESDQEKPAGAMPSHDDTEEHKDTIEHKPVDELHLNDSQNDDDKPAEVTTRPASSENSDADIENIAQSTDMPNKEVPASTTSSSLVHDDSNEHVAFDDQDQKETENTTDPQELPMKQDEHQAEHGSHSSNESGPEKPEHDGTDDMVNSQHDEVESTTLAANFMNDEVSESVKPSVIQAIAETTTEVNKDESEVISTAAPIHHDDLSTNEHNLQDDSGSQFDDNTSDDHKNTVEDIPEHNIQHETAPQEIAQTDAPAAESDIQTSSPSIAQHDQEESHDISESEPHVTSHYKPETQTDQAIFDKNESAQGETNNAFNDGMSSTEDSTAEHTDKPQEVKPVNADGSAPQHDGGENIEQDSIEGFDDTTSDSKKPTQNVAHGSDNQSQHEEQQVAGVTEVNQGDSTQIGTEKEKDENVVQMDNIPVEDVISATENINNAVVSSTENTADKKPSDSSVLSDNASGIDATSTDKSEVNEAKPTEKPEVNAVINAENDEQETVTDSSSTEKNSPHDELNSTSDEKESSASPGLLEDAGSHQSGEQNAEHPVSDEVEGDHAVDKDEAPFMDNQPTITEKTPFETSTEIDQAAGGAHGAVGPNGLAHDSADKTEHSTEATLDVTSQPDQYGSAEISELKPAEQVVNGPNDAHFSIVEVMTKPPMHSDSLVHDKVPEMEIEQSTEKQQNFFDQVSALFDTANKLPSITNLTPNHPAMQDMEEVNHHTYEEEGSDYSGSNADVSDSSPSTEEQKEDEKVAEIKPSHTEQVHSSEEVTEAGEYSSTDVAPQEQHIPGEGEILILELIIRTIFNKINFR